jgi:hypothetical protein
VDQSPDDLLRIVRVHLAPEGLDVEGLHSIFIVRERPPKAFPLLRGLRLRLSLEM